MRTLRRVPRTLQDILLSSLASKSAAFGDAWFADYGDCPSHYLGHSNRNTSYYLLIFPLVGSRNKLELVYLIPD